VKDIEAVCGGEGKSDGRTRLAVIRVWEGIRLGRSGVWLTGIVCLMLATGGCEWCPSGGDGRFGGRSVGNASISQV